MSNYILGISAYYHDSAACLIKDGQILSAVQEERFTRIKHDWSFPKQSIKYCLEHAGISAQDIDLVAFYDKPFLKFERIIETHLHYAPKGWWTFVRAMPVWIKKKIWISQLIREELGYEGKLVYPEHHESHAASAFYPSPFDSAAFLTIDGVGEWATTSYGLGEQSNLNIQADIHFPHSLGLLYSAFTYYTGFRVNSGEYKLMGLAPYGQPVYKDLILKHLIDVKADGSFKLDMQYFDYGVGSRMTNAKFHKLFGGPPRKAEAEITQREMDLAKSIQEALEEVVLKIITHVHKVTKSDNLCLAGGVALNCVSNGRIVREGPFKHVWVQPAAGDAGGALGAALFAHHHYLQHERHVEDGRDSQQGSLLGPEYSDDSIKKYLADNHVPFQSCGEDELADVVANLINNQKVIGWFQGRMEFGPRALGSRSIIGDARSAKLQEVMNLKIKFRESFRPFAPAVLVGDAPDYFQIDSESPYMMVVAPIASKRQREMTEAESDLFGIEKLNIERSDIPAVTHVDYSARIQTVDDQSNPRFCNLLKSMKSNFNSPLVINTSFNVRGEPIVMTPAQAFKCFMRTEMDVLVLGNCVLYKEQQKEIKESKNWQKEFALD
ncbi:MAG: carbamoyltransferase [Candidatus Omnitrophota bacterium]|jgi:carbamoyltransferase